MQRIDRLHAKSDDTTSAMATDVPLKELFFYGRLRRDRISKLWYVLFVLYFPIGYASSFVLRRAPS